MNAFYTFDLFNYGLYTRMQATAKNYEIRTDTRYFRKPCNNERPRYDVRQLQFEDYVHYFRMVAKAIRNGNNMAITGMFVLVFCEMPIVCDMFSLIRVCRNNL
jgi:hypothetical protein